MFIGPGICKCPIGTRVKENTLLSNL
jgi:hypothetical protein